MAPKRGTKRKRSAKAKAPKRTNTGAGVAGLVNATQTHTSQSTQPAAHQRGTAQNNQQPQSTRADRRTLTQNVSKNPGLFNLDDPELPLRQARASRRAARPHVRRALVARAAPSVQTPQTTQPSRDNVSPASQAEPATGEFFGGDEFAIGNGGVDESTGNGDAESERAEQQKAAQAEESKKKTEEAKQQTKREQFERDQEGNEEAALKGNAQEETVREEASRKRMAKKKEDAAWARHAQQETVRREATERKVSQRQKESREKAAQEKVAQEQAAERKAADKEAAQKQAAQEKAAQMEKQALIAKPTGNDQTYREWREQEDAAKMEKQRKAREQAEKEAAELAKKEAAGFKRPGARRAVPQRVGKTKDTTTTSEHDINRDDAGKRKAADLWTQPDYKGTKVDDTTSCKDLDTALSFSKFKFSLRDETEYKNPDVVKIGSHLNRNVIFQGLASMTEAINDSLVAKGERKLFSLFHPKSMIDYNLLEHPVVLVRHDALIPLDRSAGNKIHFSLVMLTQVKREDKDGRDFFTMHHYDCVPSGRAAYQNTFTRKATRSTILGTGWAGPEDGTKETILGESQNMDVCDILPGQEWSCGLHAILNGWVCAFQLKHNPNALLSKRGFYEKAVDLVNFAVRGLVGSKAILDFFNCYLYTLPDTLSESERQRRSFKETKDFETFPRLDTYLLELLGRPPRRNIDKAFKKPTLALKNVALSAGHTTSKSSDSSPKVFNKHLRGVEGPLGLPHDSGDDDNDPVDEPFLQDDEADRVRSDDDDLDEEILNIEEDEQEPEVIEYDWRGRAVTAESKAAAKFAREMQQEQQQQDQQATTHQSEDHENDSLFSADDDLQDFFGNDNDPDDNHGSAPVLVPPNMNAAPAGPISYDSLQRPSRGPYHRTGPQSVANREQEEDLYNVSPPRVPATAPAHPALFFPNPPPPTPHDATSNHNPMQLPGLGYPQASGQQPFVAPMVPQHNALQTDTPRNPSNQVASGFQVPSVPSSSASSTGSKPGRAAGQSTSGFGGLSVSSSSGGSTDPRSGVTASAVPRPIAVPNPRGAFRVPSTSVSSDDGRDGEVSRTTNGIAKSAVESSKTTTESAKSPRKSEKIYVKSAKTADDEPESAVKRTLAHSESAQPARKKAKIVTVDDEPKSAVERTMTTSESAEPPPKEAKTATANDQSKTIVARTLIPTYGANSAGGQNSVTSAREQQEQDDVDHAWGESGFINQDQGHGTTSHHNGSRLPAPGGTRAQQYQSETRQQTSKPAREEDDDEDESDGESQDSEEQRYGSEGEDAFREKQEFEQEYDYGGNEGSEES